MRKGAAVIMCIAALAACKKGGEVKAATAAPPAVAGGASFQPALRAESLLNLLGIPYEPRYDRYPEKFPEGCVWLAVYGTKDPEVILETYAFLDEKKAAEYADGWNEEPGKNRAGSAVTNGELVLVAWYKPGGDDAREEDAVARFATAFQSGNR